MSEKNDNSRPTTIELGIRAVSGGAIGHSITSYHLLLRPTLFHSGLPSGGKESRT